MQTTIIIYGQHSSDWTSAFSSKSSLWNIFPGIIVRHIDSHHIIKKSEQSVTTENIVIPLMETHIMSFIDKHNLDDFLSLIPTKSMVETFGNKLAFSEYIKHNNLSLMAPTTYTLNNIVYPCIIKRTDLNTGNGISILNSNYDLEKYLTQNKHSEYIIQNIIYDNKEFTTHCICNNGNILWHTTYIYKLKSQSMIKKTGLFPHKHEMSSEILDELQLFLQPIKYSGPCNIDYKIINNHIVVMEINPRFGGSLMSAVNRRDLQQAIKTIIDVLMNKNN